MVLPCYVHRDIACNVTGVVDECALCHPQRLLLVNPLDNDDQLPIMTFIVNVLYA